jgi:hypothetical protein
MAARIINIDRAVSSGGCSILEQGGVADIPSLFDRVYAA